MYTNTVFAQACMSMYLLSEKHTHLTVNYKSLKAPHLVLHTHAAKIAFICHCATYCTPPKRIIHTSGKPRTVESQQLAGLTVISFDLFIVYVPPTSRDTPLNIKNEMSLPGSMGDNDTVQLFALQMPLQALQSYGCCVNAIKPSKCHLGDKSAFIPNSCLAVYFCFVNIIIKHMLKSVTLFPYLFAVCINMQQY